MTTIAAVDVASGRELWASSEVEEGSRARVVRWISLSVDGKRARRFASTGRGEVEMRPLDVETGNETVAIDEREPAPPEPPRYAVVSRHEHPWTRVITLYDRREARTIEVDGVLGAESHPVVSGGRFAFADGRDSRTRIVDLASGRTVELARGSYPLRPLAFLRGGEWLVTLADAPPTRSMRLSMRSGPVMRPDDLVEDHASEERSSIVIWDATSGEPVAGFREGYRVRAWITPDEKQLVWIRSGDEAIYVGALPNLP